MAAADLDAKVMALERVARGLSREQILGFIPAMRVAPSQTWKADFPYWFQGTSGVKLTKDEKTALSRLWTRMLAGLAFAASGQEVEEWVQRPGFMAWLDRVVEPRRSGRIEFHATLVLERMHGGDVWLGVVGIWNAFCASLLGERLDPSLRSELTSVWRTVMGREL